MHSSPRPVRLVVSLGLAVLTTACGGTDASRSGTRSNVLPDANTGIAITENDAERLEHLPRWSLDTAPVFRIAGDEQVFSVLGSVVRRADGRIFVFDLGQKDVRQLSPTGRFERIVARNGRGPGEVAYAGYMQIITGDSLMIFDGSQRRATIFDSSGSYVRQIPYPRLPGLPRMSVLAVLGDSRTWLVALRPPAPKPTAPDSRVVRAEYLLARLTLGDPATDSTGADIVATMDTVAIGLDEEQFAAPHNDGRSTELTMQDLIFGRETVVAAKGSRVFVGTNESDEIAIFRGAERTGLIRNARAPIPVRQEDRSAWRAALRRSFLAMRLPPAELPIFEESLRGYRFADVFPHYIALLACEDGDLWVEQWRSSPDHARRYLVYDSAGMAISRLELPLGVSPLSCRRDELLGTFADEDYVRSIAVWRLRTGVAQDVR